MLACTLCRYGWCVHGMSRLMNVLCILRNSKECAHCMYVVIHLCKDYCTSYMYSHTVRTRIQTLYTHSAYTQYTNTHTVPSHVHKHSTNMSTNTQYTHLHTMTWYTHVYIHTVHTLYTSTNTQYTHIAISTIMYFWFLLLRSVDTGQ